ncbi:MAG: Hpt domain-containing protein [Nonlabens sp.]|uniref:Hpt domain-containing protein n=1 Tax=Nonlabens sp. TaxID=1888209 RepID=UPI003EF89A59
MSEILQLTTLTDNFGADPETFVQILNIFLEEVPVDYTLLQKQINAGDFKNAGETAHKVKSSYRLLDMEIETLLLQEIETRSKEEKETQGIAQLFAQFDMNYGQGILLVEQTRNHYMSNDK